MTRILLIRHGSNDLFGRVLYGRMPGVHLNGEGNRQARELAAALKQRYDLAAVVSSPLERAMETARPIADAHGVGVAIDNGLNEIDFGDWAAKPFSELHESAHWREYNRLRSLTRAPKGESLLDAQARASQSLESIHARHRDAAVAVITHADIIRALLVLLLGMPLDHALRLELAPASVSEIVLGGRYPLVRTINEMLIATGDQSPS